MITVTIFVKPYLAAYLQSAYAHCTIEGAIRFTKNQNLYSCLLQLTTPRPKGVSWRDQGNITFSLPCPSVGKDPRTYNYLGEEAVKILEQEINYEMRMDYYRFLRRNKFKNGMMFTKATELYLEDHGMMELIDVTEELFFVGEEGGKKIELYFLYATENIITHTTYTISFSNFVK